MGPREPARGRRAQPLKRTARPGDVAPVDPVGGPAGDQGQREQGNELDDADKAELERGVLEIHRLAGDVVNLPADHHDHADLRDGRSQPGEPIDAKVGDPERFGEETHPRRLAAAFLSGNRPRRVRQLPDQPGHRSPGRRIEKATTTKAATMIAPRSAPMAELRAPGRAPARRASRPRQSVLIGRRQRQRDRANSAASG